MTVRFLETSLRSDGFSVEAVAHVSEAIHNCLKRRYGMAIVSLGYIGWSETEERLEPLRILKGIDAELPIVVLCDEEGIEVERQLRAEGIFYLLARPFSLVELRNVVECAIRREKSEHRR